MHTTQQSLMLTDSERASIMRFINDIDGDAAILIATQGKQQVPDELQQLFRRVVHAVVNGQSISISSLPVEVTTTTAASMLGVSRPTVMKYIRSGRLTARKVGSHHRLKTHEVLELAEEKKQQQREAVFELIEFEESLVENSA